MPENSLKFGKKKIFCTRFFEKSDNSEMEFLTTHAFNTVFWVYEKNIEERLILANILINNNSLHLFLQHRPLFKHKKLNEI